MIHILNRYLKESRGDGLVGIWWYTGTDIIGVSKSVDDGEIDGPYVQYSNTENHLTLWRKVISSNFSSIEANNIISKGYKSLERGTVIYDLRTRTYLVTCSNDLINNIEFRKKIIYYFNLNDDRVDFEPLSHYRKVELTSNSALDNFKYSI